MTRPCALEDAVVALALAGPGAAPSSELQAHLVVCPSCREIQGLVAVLHDDRAAALSEVQVPSAGLVWWKATLRARHEDAVRATRPITLVAGLTAACLVGVLASVAGMIAWWVQGTAAAVPVVQVVTAALASAAPGAETFTVMRLAVWLVTGVLAIAMPVLLYVALREE